MKRADQLHLSHFRRSFQYTPFALTFFFYMPGSGLLFRSHGLVAAAAVWHSARPEVLGSSMGPDCLYDIEEVEDAPEVIASSGH